MLAELLAHPGVEEDLELRSAFGMMAFHGGSLERGTDTIAAAAAARSGASLYAIRQPPDLRWHIPSIDLDPAASPALTRFLGHVEVAVAVHGYGRDGMWTTLLLGGRNRALAAELGVSLRHQLGDGFTVVDELDDVPADLRGVHPRNPVNGPARQGVQLELPPRVREGNDVPTYRAEYSEAIVEALASVARSWIAGS
ncbi:MAG: poly-gamma-glutamate hydrolase family protein [Actinomycetota bacterium]|nr:poly-gamma-glutamate hydrolase family protein [Acidimicrobiia bacterium]MDQ3293734.1 poly-gamma-glutamate hydrolase family protein [Actinomycetota bacterium]